MRAAAAVIVWSILVMGLTVGGYSMIIVSDDVVGDVVGALIGAVGLAALSPVLNDLWSLATARPEPADSETRLRVLEERVSAFAGELQDPTARNLLSYNEARAARLALRAEARARERLERAEALGVDLSTHPYGPHLWEVVIHQQFLNRHIFGPHLWETVAYSRPELRWVCQNEVRATRRYTNRSDFRPGYTVRPPTAARPRDKLSLPGPVAGVRLIPSVRFALRLAFGLSLGAAIALLF